MKIPALVACHAIATLSQSVALARDLAPRALIERQVHELTVDVSAIEFSRFTGEFLVFKTGEGGGALETVERRSGLEFALIEEVALPDGFDQLVQVSGSREAWLGLSESGDVVAFNPVSREVMWRFDSVADGEEALGFGLLEGEIVLLSENSVRTVNVESGEARESVAIGAHFTGMPEAVLGPLGEFVVLYEDLSRDPGETLLVGFGPHGIKPLEKPFQGARFFFGSNEDLLYAAGAAVDASGEVGEYKLYEYDVLLPSVSRSLSLGGEGRSVFSERPGISLPVAISPEGVFLFTYFEGESRVVDLNAWKIKARPVPAVDLAASSGKPYFATEEAIYVNLPERGFLRSGVFEGRPISVELANRDEELWLDFETFAERLYLRGVSGDLSEWDYDAEAIAWGDGTRRSVRAGESFPQFNRVFEFDIPL